MINKLVRRYSTQSGQEIIVRCCAYQPDWDINVQVNNKSQSKTQAAVYRSEIRIYSQFGAHRIQISESDSPVPESEISAVVAYLRMMLPSDKRTPLEEIKSATAKLRVRIVKNIGGVLSGNYETESIQSKKNVSRARLDSDVFHGLEGLVDLADGMGNSDDSFRSFRAEKLA